MHLSLCVAMFPSGCLVLHDILDRPGHNMEQDSIERHEDRGFILDWLSDVHPEGDSHPPPRLDRESDVSGPPRDDHRQTLASSSRYQQVPSSSHARPDSAPRDPSPAPRSLSRGEPSCDEPDLCESERDIYERRARRKTRHDRYDVNRHDTRRGHATLLDSRGRQVNPSEQAMRNFSSAAIPNDRVSVRLRCLVLRHLPTDMGAPAVETEPHYRALCEWPVIAWGTKYARSAFLPSIARHAANISQWRISPLTT